MAVAAHDTEYAPYTAVMLDSERLQVKEFGETTFIRDGIYYKTNHFIKQSRPYVQEGNKLTRYLHLPGLQWVFLLCWLAGFPAPANNIYAFAMAVVHSAWFLLFAQHMYVSVKTMPRVLSQPVVPNPVQRSLNSFYEITLEKYRMGFAASQTAGVGIIVHGKGTVKIQIFNWTARRYMRSCIAVSTVALLGVTVMFCYCLAFGIKKTVEQKGFVN